MTSRPSALDRAPRGASDDDSNATDRRLGLSFVLAYRMTTVAQAFAERKRIRTSANVIEEPVALLP